MMFVFRLQVFNIYLKRAAEAFGITHTREIYEKAIDVLPDVGARCDYVIMYGVNFQLWSLQNRNIV